MVGAPCIFGAFIHVFLSSDCARPTNMKVTQQFPGSHRATLTWSFPKKATSALLHFHVVTKKDGHVVNEQCVASQERQVSINNLQPSTKYTITVRANYRNELTVASDVEHTNYGILI